MITHTVYFGSCRGAARGVVNIRLGSGSLADVRLARIVVEIAATATGSGGGTAWSDRPSRSALGCPGLFLSTSVVAPELMGRLVPGDRLEVGSVRVALGRRGALARSQSAVVPGPIAA